MSRYIDADALREKWLCLQGHDFSPSSFVYSIDNAPTVDAVPVVRCGECKYFIENTWECVRFSDRFGDEYSDARVYPEYYCADGERKDGERRTE